MPKPGVLPGDKVIQASLVEDSGLATAVPDTDTEVAHRLGKEPTTVILTPQSTGVIGYALESARSATSITIRGNVSGVDVRWKVIG